MTRIAHKLRDRVDLQKAIKTKTPTKSGYKRDYENIHKNIPAEVADISPRSMIANKNTGDGVTTHITMRYLPDVKKGLFLVTVDNLHPARRFKILSIKNAERREYIVIACEEIEEGV